MKGQLEEPSYAAEQLQNETNAVPTFREANLNGFRGLTEDVHGFACL